MNTALVASTPTAAPIRDFQDTLREFGQRMREKADSDEVFGEALRASEQLIAQGSSMTANVTAALAGLAAALALGLQDHARDGISQVVHGTPLQTWALLPEDTRELLEALWPEEGGLQLLGKIGIAVVSEGFNCS